jgi:hypothetical protein
MTTGTNDSKEESKARVAEQRNKAVTSPCCHHRQKSINDMQYNVAIAMNIFNTEPPNTSVDVEPQNVND